MDKVLIYFPFALAKKADSGSKVRPLKMIEAFEMWGRKEGLEVVVVSGESKERKSKWDELMRQKALTNVRFCYVENQTIPIWLTDKNHIPSKPFIDKQVFEYLKKHQIPMGIFYRDVYWKFDELYPLKGLKKTAMQWLYRREEKFYEKYADAIFLPSLEMGKYVDINRTKVALPPGGKEVVFQKANREDTEVRAIYVGAVQHADNGLPLMLDTLERVKGEGLPLSLTVVCREAEYQGLAQTQKAKMDELQVVIKHLSGAELDKLYEEYDFAYLPRTKSTYNDFSVPVKLVEYLSNYLPVLASNCTAQQRFVESGPYGVVAEATVEAMVEATKAMINQHNTYLQTIQDRFLTDNSWIARVKTVSNTLTKRKTESS
ncbi:glycosyltransferase [Shimazuella alba]|jgi:glycosyltransferase involved in cell wall biosynthesis|uniref:Glycosyltransferase n=1 Tax=Shimazuella alba TaxID=2690964 RepID=A0A6I4W144_9BACL|nr:glycosyltransferase [Shimazuella alba]MXQ55980.1 glycosyltransferase [Shimazuella alba]